MSVVRHFDTFDRSNLMQDSSDCLTSLSKLNRLSYNTSEQQLVDTLLYIFADQLTLHDAKPTKLFETH